MSRWTKVALFLLCLTAFAIPIEYEYNKLFRHFSKTLIPENLILPQGFQKLIYFYRSDLAAIVLFVIAIFGLRIPLRRLLFEKGASFLWIVFFFATLSILFSPLAHYPVVYTRLLQLFTPFLLFSVLANLPISPTKWIFLSIAIAGLLQSAFAITQYFLQSPLGLSFLGEPQRYTSAFGLSSGNRWIFDQLFHRTANTTTIMRVHGTFTHPNILGGFIALSLLATYSLIMELKNDWARKILALSLPIQFFAMCLTFSRSAIFGWVIGTLIWFGLLFWRKGIPSNAAFRFLTFMIVLSPILSTSLLSEQFLQRGGIINYNSLSQGSDATRIEYQNKSLELIKKHPLTGVGFQQYSFTDGPTHNIYLFLATETGLLSLTAFLLFLFFLLRAIFLMTVTFQTASLAAIFLCFLFIGCCDFYPILYHSGKLMFFITAGLLARERKVGAYAFA